MDALWQQWKMLDPAVSILAAVPLLGLALLLGQIARRETAVRGARVAGANPLRRLYWHCKANMGDLLNLAGKPILRLDETKHFKLIGTTGTGKSTAIAGLLGAALQRGDRAVIADPDGWLLRTVLRCLPRRPAAQSVRRRILEVGAAGGA